eukprot:1462998-Rhodomonas_salina.1
MIICPGYVSDAGHAHIWRSYVYISGAEICIHVRGICPGVGRAAGVPDLCQPPLLVHRQLLLLRPRSEHWSPFPTATTTATTTTATTTTHTLLKLFL